MHLVQAGGVLLWCIAKLASMTEPLGECVVGGLLDLPDLLCSAIRTCGAWSYEVRRRGERALHALPAKRVCCVAWGAKPTHPRQDPGSFGGLLGECCVFVLWPSTGIVPFVL